jgi:drug/metabolite transporter (DMT)-like permease
MAVIGWGIEGAVAAKGLDVSDSDVALTIRFIMEVAIWWLFIIPILILLGFPVLKYTLMIFDPITLLVLTVLGFTFGFSYVTWYRAFPLLGVGMGQSLGSLYGLFAVVFLFLFVGQGQSWTLLLGAALCITGTFVMFTEKTSRIESLRELDSKEESL